MKSIAFKRGHVLFVPEDDQVLTSSVKPGPLTLAEYEEQKQQCQREADEAWTASATANHGSGNAGAGGAPETRQRTRPTFADLARVKRAYVWRSGGKRAGEGSIAKKLKLNQDQAKTVTKEKNDSKSLTKC